MDSAVALGTFDGVHKGHLSVLNLEGAHIKTAVIFRKPPKLIVSGRDDLITTIEDKCRLLHKVGINNVYILDFEKVRDMSAEDFFKFIRNKFNPSLISCGYNYKFGKGGIGDTKLLSNLCNREGIVLKCVSPVLNGNIAVSSTLIRNMLRDGKIDSANKLLSEDFSYSGGVICGDKRGRTIGFPTVNQKYPDELVQLKLGVYKTRVLFDNKIYKGITDIGIRPTFRTDYIISETNIVGFSGDLYGKNIRIIPERFLRSEKVFSSVEELKNQIAKDLNS